MPIRLLFATRNSGKIAEARAILGPSFEVLPLPPEAPSVEETGSTFCENAQIKALAALPFAQGAWVAADDSGLEVDALQGEPGVHSSRFATPAASDAENLEVLLTRLEGVPLSERRARFRCVIALAHQKKDLRFFEGVVEGHITLLPAGSNGFGYDPVFIPAGHICTFAEMPAELKNTISHRGQALAAMARALLPSHGT